MKITGGRVTGTNDGGGIFTYGDLRLESVFVTGNEAGEWGGGIYVDVSGSLTLIDSTIDLNVADAWGGGIAGRLVGMASRIPWSHNLSKRGTQRRWRDDLRTVPKFNWEDRQ